MNTIAPAPRRPVDPPAGVAGWLLVLCVFLVFVGPAIVAGLLLDRQWVVGARLAGSVVLGGLFIVTQVLTVAATAWGMVAGWRLWRIRPGAVGTTRRALLAALAVDLSCAVFDVATHPTLAAEGSVVRQALWSALPDLVCFTACLGYLHHSRRVQATYPDEETAR